MLVTDDRKVAVRYFKSRQFIIDVIASIPVTYIASYITGVAVIWYRLVTLLKLPRVQECSERGWRLSSYPLVYRFASVTMVIIVFMHYNTCIYYKVSEMIGFSTNDWVFDALSYPHFPANYLNCFYWVACHLSGVNGLPWPQRTVEIVFMTVNYMIGVLYIANVVGDISTIFSSQYETELKNQNFKDELKGYMTKHEITKKLQNKILRWLEQYQAEHGGSGAEGDQEKALSMLPLQKLTQINMDIHLMNLRKVRIFQSSDPLLLVYLVNLLKLQLFCPGDRVCTKGEVGTEMYIVKSGELDVIGFDGKSVMATLKAGTIFGELALLDIKGAKHGNRRTATVVSKGYTHAYTLTKEDLLEAFDLFPGAKEEFENKGREILTKDGLMNETVETPKTLQEYGLELVAKNKALDERVGNLAELVHSIDLEYAASMDRVEEKMENIFRLFKDNLSDDGADEDF